MKIDPKIKTFITDFEKHKMNDSIDYIKKLKQLSKELTFEQYLMQSFISFPEHKWHLNLREEYINAYREVFFYLKSNYNILSKMKSFEELIQYINKLNVKYFGELSTYDVSLSLGILFNIMPNKVYLHAGPRKTMKYILGNEYNNKVTVKNNIEYIDVEEIPEIFNSLKKMPYLLEDCLCFIWSNYIKSTVNF